MKTSVAQANGHKCPKCKDETTRDRLGRGFVRHKANKVCKYGQGEKD